MSKRPVYIAISARNGVFLEPFLIIADSIESLHAFWNICIKLDLSFVLTLRIQNFPNYTTDLETILILRRT